MTIGGWLACVLIALLVVGCGLLLSLWLWDDYKGASIVALILTVILAIVPFIVGFWYYNNTESGMRAMKDQESNFGDGINRVVTIYDVNGNVIATYEGRFDIETDKDSYILFDDEDGYRHVIYYTTGTITIDEIPG